MVRKYNPCFQAKQQENRKTIKSLSEESVHSTI